MGNIVRSYLSSSYHELAGDGWLVGEGVDVLGLARVGLLLVEDDQKVSDGFREVSSQQAQGSKAY